MPREKITNRQKNLSRLVKERKLMHRNKLKNLKKEVGMIKKIVIFVIITSFAMCATSIAGGGEKSTCQKSVFQKASDNMSDFSDSVTANKKPMTDAFQNSYNYIIESAPRAKKLNLRGNQAELDRRMGKK